MRILLLKTVEDIHPYTRFTQGLYSALRELGHAPEISDQSVHTVEGTASVAPLVAQLQASRFDAVLSFSSFFGGVTLADSSSLYDALGIRFVGWQLDHPIYSPQSLARALHNRFAVYSNHNHQRFVEALGLPGRGLTMLPGVEPPTGPVRAHAQRTCDVFIAAAFNGAPERLWEQFEDSAGKRLLEEVVARLLADREASLLDAFNAASESLELGAALGVDPDFDAQMIEFLRVPLTYVRHLDRTVAIRTLADAGIPFTLCGAGWREFLGDRPHVTYIDRHIPFAEMPALYADARIVINLNAGNGACERALQAAMAGAAVVSDYSADLAAQFGGAGGDVTFFDRSGPDNLAAAVGTLLAADDTEARAQRAHERVLRSGLWRNRAQQLMDFLQAP